MKDQTVKINEKVFGSQVYKSLTDLTGRRFDRLVVLSLVFEKGKKAKWLCQCDCGNAVTVLGESLKSTNTRSCGCFRKEVASSNGTFKPKDVCEHGYPRIAGNKRDCNCPVRMRQKRSANLKHCYGISLDDFNDIIEEQNGRCLGCGRVFVLDANGIFDGCLDHDHGTGRIRGALCRQCNAALGCVKESPETLRRLMAYLDTDRKKPLVYLIGRLKNHKIVEIANFLRRHGYDVFEDWYYVGPDADDWWQKREKARGRTYIEALRGRAAQNTFLFDKSYLDMARAVVLVAPAGKSAFMELGYSKGGGKATFILLPGGTLKRYEVMTKFADAVLETKEDILKSLNARFGEQHVAEVE